MLFQQTPHFIVSSVFKPNTASGNYVPPKLIGICEARKMMLNFCKGSHFVFFSF